MKISVISVGGAGRCCFYLGMVKNLLLSCSDDVGYVSKKGYSYCYHEVFRLSDQTLSLDERLPDPRDRNLICELCMDDGYGGRTSIKWVDVKSEHLQGGCYNEDWTAVHGSDCIMICLDGSDLENATGSTQEIADYWYENSNSLGNGGDIDNFMRNYLRLNNGKLPFICFVVTKMDTMDPNLLKCTTLDRIVSRTFPDWFEGRTRNGGHIAAVCPISALGYEFMDGGPFNPVNAEKPLLAALKVVSGKTYGDLDGVRFYRDGKWIDESEV